MRVQRTEGRLTFLSVRPSLHFVAVLAVVTAACGARELPPSAPSVLLGRPIPDFRRPTLDGSTFDTKDERGHVVIVKFFAKYCEPCKRTLPEVERLHRERPDVAVVGLDEDEHEWDAREVVATYGLTFPVVHDAGNILFGRYRVRDLPMTFVVDASGSVRWTAASVGAHDALARAVEAAR